MSQFDSAIQQRLQALQSQQSPDIAGQIAALQQQSQNVQLSPGQTILASLGSALSAFGGQPRDFVGQIVDTKRSQISDQMQLIGLQSDANRQDLQAQLAELDAFLDVERNKRQAVESKQKVSTGKAQEEEAKQTFEQRAELFPLQVKEQRAKTLRAELENEGLKAENVGLSQRLDAELVNLQARTEKLRADALASGETTEYYKHNTKVAKLEYDRNQAAYEAALASAGGNPNHPIMLAFGTENKQLMTELLSQQGPVKTEQQLEQIIGQWLQFPGNEQWAASVALAGGFKNLDEGTHDMIMDEYLADGLAAQMDMSHSSRNIITLLHESKNRSPFPIVGDEGFSKPPKDNGLAHFYRKEDELSSFNGLAKTLAKGNGFARALHEGMLSDITDDTIIGQKLLEIYPRIPDQLSKFTTINSISQILLTKVNEERKKMNLVPIITQRQSTENARLEDVKLQKLQRKGKSKLSRFKTVEELSSDIESGERFK